MPGYTATKGEHFERGVDFLKALYLSGNISKLFTNCQTLSMETSILFLHCCPQCQVLFQYKFSRYISLNIVIVGCFLILVLCYDCQLICVLSLLIGYFDQLFVACLPLSWTLGVLQFYYLWVGRMAETCAHSLLNCLAWFKILNQL